MLDWPWCWRLWLHLPVLMQVPYNLEEVTRVSSTSVLLGEEEKKKKG